MPVPTQQPNMNTPNYYSEQHSPHWIGGRPQLDTMGYQNDIMGLDVAARNMQLNMTQAEMNRINAQTALQNQQAQMAGQWADEFMGAWNTGRTELTGMFNQALDFLNVDSDNPFGAYADIANEIQVELQTFRDTYSPLQGEAIETAREGLQTQRGLMSNIRDAAVIDQNAGGRAMHDVGDQAEMGRRAESREMSGLGINPASGAWGGARRSRIDEAIGKVLASNQATRGERDRVAGVSAQGLQVIRPGEAAGIATNISGQTQNLMGMEAGLATTNQAQNIQRAGVAGSIADQYGQSLVQPVGEWAASMMGTGMATGPGQLPSPRGLTSPQYNPNQGWQVHNVNP